MTQGKEKRTIGKNIRHNNTRTDIYTRKALHNKQVIIKLVTIQTKGPQSHGYSVYHNKITNRTHAIP